MKIVKGMQGLSFNIINELKKVGIIKGTIEGTSVCYCIDEEKWGSIRNKFNKFLNKNPTENCC